MAGQRAETWETMGLMWAGMWDVLMADYSAAMWGLWAHWRAELSVAEWVGNWADSLGK